MGSLDEQLVPRAVAGDEAALSALLECNGAQVRSALHRSYHRRLSGQVDLDDVMQVTYLEAFLRVRDFVPAGPNSFRAWLGRIAENNLRDAIRKSDALDRHRSHGALSPCDQSGPASFDPSTGSHTPSRVAGRDEAEGLLEAALRQLPEDYERVLRLYDLAGYSGPQVARQIGRSHGAVKMLVARARDRLSELLGSGSKYFSHRA
ncbi:MAG: sigma-70 family RNA polymerase sigma factor [Dehalococcoidia bacterium]